GFHHPHSYRGFYEELAFEPTGRTTVGEMLAAALDAHGTTYVGWKGGEYITMHGGSLCWLALEGSAGGEEITAELLTELLADVVRSAAETPTGPPGTRAFTRDQLADIGVPFELDGDEGTAQELSNRIVGSERWTDVRELVFRAPDDGLAYRVTYEVGSTE
ncbi:hypothetical protein G3I76_25935, partial [Streptomyces sp. SID11233]|nr:hypothetical protein [Streptomyces sp. SID11233]